MLAKFKALKEIDPDDKEIIDQELMPVFAESEIESILALGSAQQGQSYDLDSLRDHLLTELDQEANVASLDVLRDILLETKAKLEGQDNVEDRLKAIDEILGVIEGPIKEYQGKGRQVRQPVAFAKDAEIKTVIIGRKIVDFKPQGNLVRSEDYLPIPAGYEIVDTSV